MNETTGHTRAGVAAIARLYEAIRARFALVGMAAVLLVALPDPRGAAERQIAPETTPDAAGAGYAVGIVEPGDGASPASREQQAVAEFLARRFRVAEEAVAGFVSSAYRAGREWRVDPLLILAVIAVESRYNPVAESAFGAKGLMQVIPRFHMDKLEPLGGRDALLEPETNIRVGTQILREYLRRFGETESALQMYAGAFDDANAGYAAKVLAERARLEQMLVRVRRAA